LDFRRDSFCGKMSACNNLRQYGIAYSLTTLHTVDPTARASAPTAPVRRSLRVVRGMRRARFRHDRRAPGRLQHSAVQRKAAGARGISVDTLDLSEVFARSAAWKTAIRAWRPRRMPSGPTPIRPRFLPRR